MNHIALLVEGLTKIYPMKTGQDKAVEALKGISFTVESGDFFALLGPNGAGKSTTIGILCSLINKTAGKVRIFGVDIDEDFVAAKRLIGIVPQEFNFGQFEKVEDILIDQAGYYGIPRNQAIPIAEKNLKQLGLWEKRHQPSRNLSGGMKRRLMIARALMHRPKLLILDEPTAGVDVELRRSMWDFLQNLNKEGVTIILTTHYLEEAENLCRNIAIINQGQIIEYSSMKSLLGKLSVETFIFDVKENNHLPAIAGFESRWVNAQTLEVCVNKGQAFNELFDRFKEMAIEVISLKNKSNRLEELFLRLVEKNNV